VADSELAQTAEHSVVLEHLDENSIVTTRSTSGCLLALMAWCQEGSALPADHLAQAGEALLEEADAVAARAAEEGMPSACFFLGSGPLFGLAREGALKSNETALVPTAAFHALEFRHGPKSLLSSDTLTVGLLGPATAQEDAAVLNEANTLGSRTMAICLEKHASLVSECDYVVAIESGLGYPWALVAFLPPLQLLGLRLALRRGLDPDKPPNLSRFVALPGS